MHFPGSSQLEIISVDVVEMGLLMYGKQYAKWMTCSVAVNEFTAHLTAVDTIGKLPKTNVSIKPYLVTTNGTC